MNPTMTGDREKGERGETVSLAFVLCAGEGQRLRPLTDHVPKCLLPLANRPMALHVIEALRTVGVDRFVVNIHTLADQVRRVLGDYAKREGIEISFSEEKVLLGTGGALLHARPFLDEPFLLVNCDFIARGFPFDRLMACRRRQAILAVRKMAVGEKFNPVGVAGDRLVRVSKSFGSGGEDHVFLGAHVIDHRLLDFLIADREIFGIFEGLYKPAFEHGVAFDAFVTDHDSDFDPGTPTGYLEANLALSGGRPVIAEDAALPPGTIVERSVVLPGSRILQPVVIRDSVVMGDVAADQIGKLFVHGLGREMGPR